MENDCMPETNHYITAELAQWAAQLSYEEISPGAIHHARRFLLDSLGCALAGFNQPDTRIALSVLEEVAGVGPATLIGKKKKVDVVSASLANALMIRCMDYNDVYWAQDPSHPSDLIPAALSCCERAGGSGREFLLGIVLGHEMEMRFCDAAIPGIRERGWHHATFTAFVSPIVAGRMLHLDWRQIQNAIGISASSRATFGAVTAGELTMMKNTADPLATQNGVFSALLAEQGYSGPAHVIDGKEGLMHCLGPDWDLGALRDGLGSSWRINRCGIKAFPTEALTHTPISAVLDLVREHGLVADEIKTVRIRTLARAADILADPSKYDPQTKETADHSLPYVIAAALVDRNVTPAHFSQAKISDPFIRAQLHKVEVIADPDIEREFPAKQKTIVELFATNGRQFVKALDYPKGDPRNPLSDDELEQKFDALAANALSSTARRLLIETVWNLDRLDMLAPLTALL
jgi:2-methylcitrate dehydratase